MEFDGRARGSLLPGGARRGRAADLPRRPLATSLAPRRLGPCLRIRDRGPRRGAARLAPAAASASRSARCQRRFACSRCRSAPARPRGLGARRPRAAPRPPGRRPLPRERRGRCPGFGGRPARQAARPDRGDPDRRRRGRAHAIAPGSSEARHASSFATRRGSSSPGCRGEPARSRAERLARAKAIEVSALGRGLRPLSRARALSVPAGKEVRFR